MNEENFQKTKLRVDIKVIAKLHKVIAQNIFLDLSIFLASQYASLMHLAMSIDTGNVIKQDNKAPANFIKLSLHAFFCFEIKKCEIRQA